MIKYREKTYSEYDAMRELYNELNKYNYDEKKFEVISKSYLPGILRGNSVVVEKFTSVTKVFGRDRYRMYIRVGTKAKMPDEVRMPKTYYDENLAGISLNIDKGTISTSMDRSYSSKNKNNGGPSLKFTIQNTVSKLLGDAIVYNKKDRLLVLELDTVRDAVQALNVLPFGLGYKIYLLD